MGAKIDVPLVPKGRVSLIWVESRKSALIALLYLKIHFLDLKGRILKVLSSSHINSEFEILGATPVCDMNFLNAGAHVMIHVLSYILRIRVTRKLLRDVALFRRKFTPHSHTNHSPSGISQTMIRITPTPFVSCVFASRYQIACCERHWLEKVSGN